MGPVPNGLIFSQRVLVPNDTCGQPVVAANFVQSIFAPRILNSALKFPCLGKLPRPAGWQLALPRKRNCRSPDRRIPPQADRVLVREYLFPGMMRLGRFWFS